MKIAVLVSGGVDSSVALQLLKNDGHDVTAFYLKIWLQDEFSFLGDCPWEEDLEFVRKVCEQTNVPLEVLSLQNEYWEKVVSYTISEIKEGRTPNPDMFCNRLIKFGEFYDKIDASFEKVASGHYANISYENEKYYLKRSPDPIKDQTYFLGYLTQQQ
ncbi:MAG: tRNA 2-thiouridine(34) synthase MnmA, partial [Ignavibacteriaceae bacterium]